MNNKLVNVLADEGSYLALTSQECGVETGMMTVLSRPVCVITVDQHVKIGSEKQLLYMIDKTVQTGLPLLLLFSEKETLDSPLNFSAVTKALVRLSGVCPLIALMEKEAGELASVLIPFVDFCIYASGSHERSSSVYQALDLPDAVENLRTILSYLPLNCAEKAPLLKYTGGSKQSSIADPETAFAVYFDAHTKLEFVRINGRSAGVITASNAALPAHAARFIQFCDCYSLPLILIAEADLTLDAKQLFLLAQATVPLVAVGEMQKHASLFDAVFSTLDGTHDNVAKTLEFLCVKRDVLPPHKHGNMPL